MARKWRNALSMSPSSTPSVVPVPAPLQWRTCPPVIRLWAFWLSIFTLFLCGALILWGVTLFSTSTNAGIAATGGGLLLAALFGTHLLAIRRGWSFGWPLQIGLSLLFLVCILLSIALKLGFARAEVLPTREKVLLGFGVLPALVHGRILAGWFKAEVKAWFGRALKVL